jgi:predicted metal-dependent TIM-barrel fold hydrolase
VSPAPDSLVDERAAINLQIVQEASQHTEEDVSLAEPSADAPREESMELPDVEEPAQPEAVVGHVEVGMDEPREEEVETVGEEIPAAGPKTTVEEDIHTPEKTSMEKIMEALRGSLAELQTAALSREEVHQVEDMFMDMKRELYAAEFRGRK